MKRGLAAEFAIIIGLVLLALVVITSVYIIPSSVPSYVAEEQRAVRASVTDLIREAGEETLRAIELHGGYLTQSWYDGTDGSGQTVPFTIFAGNGVPYWSECNRTSIPDIATIKSNFEAGIRKYINDSIKDLNFTKPVSFNLTELDATVAISDEKIDITVRLPTEVMNYTTTTPYIVSIPTKFGRIYNFATDFAKEVSANRQFERFTISSIYFSRTLPTFGVMTDCGVKFLSPREVSDALERSVRETVERTLLWQAVTVDPDQPRAYSIETVNGKVYSDLDASLWLPDNFAIDVRTPVMLMNTETMHPLLPTCIAFYSQNYSVAYPIVVRVIDETTKNDFYFAHFVFVDDKGESQGMQPGDCASTLMTGGCENTECQTEFLVRNSTGHALEGVIASYNGCYINVSGQDGIIRGDVPCEQGELSLYKEGYEYFNVPLISASVRFGGITTYDLHKRPKLTINFEELNDDCTRKPVDNENVIVALQERHTGHEYYLSNVNVTSVDENCVESYKSICASCSQSNDQSTCTQCAQGINSCTTEEVMPTITTDFIPGGDYIINLTVTNSALNPSDYTCRETVLSEIPIMIPGMSKYATPFEATIPEHNATMTVYLPDSDIIYQQALDICNDWCDRYCTSCWPTEICFPSPGSSDAAKGLALIDAVTRIIGGCEDMCTVDEPAYVLDRNLRRCNKDIITEVST